MQRFQVPYNLKEVPEIQEYLKDAFEQSKNRTDLQDLYRRRSVSSLSAIAELSNDHDITAF